MRTICPSTPSVRSASAALAPASEAPTITNVGPDGITRPPLAPSLPVVRQVPAILSPKYLTALGTLPLLCSSYLGKPYLSFTVQFVVQFAAQFAVQEDRWPPQTPASY